MKTIILEAGNTSAAPWNEGGFLVENWHEDNVTDGGGA